MGNQDTGGAVVLGGAGIVGSYLCRELADRGFEVTAVDQREPVGFHAHLLDSPNINLRIADITEGDVLSSILAETKPQALYNLIAAMQAQINQSIRKGMQLNIDLACDVFQAAEDHDIPRVISTSSRAAYGPPPRTEPGVLPPLARTTDVCRPDSTYSKTKLLVEEIVAWYWRRSGGRYCGVRTATQWGLREEFPPGMRKFSLYSSMLETALAGDRFEAAVKAERPADVISNLDIARALATAATADPFSTHVYNVGTATPTYIPQMVAAMERALGWSNYQLDEETLFDEKLLPVYSYILLDLHDTIFDWGWKPQLDFAEDVSEYAKLWSGYRAS